MAPKVSYLQYEIMEVAYKKNFQNLNVITGYKNGSLTLRNAVEALIRKGLLNNENELTSEGIILLSKHYDERHKHKIYTTSELSLEKIGATKFDSVSRWYKYLEDFPPEFVSNTIKRFKIDRKYYIFDPFNGSATTLIESKKAGYKSVGLDINPAMTFIAKAKLNWNLKTSEIRTYYDNIISNFIKAKFVNGNSDYISKTTLANMPRAELNQWLSPVKQNELAFLMLEVEKITNKKYQDVFYLALIRSAINASYVAFCPGTTFYPFRKKRDLIIEFKESIAQIVTDLDDTSEVVDNRNVESAVLLGSSKDINSMKKYVNNVDLIITSPPYPNDLEYTRQTRLEMYILGVVSSMNDVQQVKRGMVKGSTKLIYNTDEPVEEVLKMETLNRITRQVAFNLKDKNWGFDYPKMLKMYFSDMYECLKIYYEVLVKGGAAVLVVGDQTTKGVLVPVAEILEEMAKQIGFSKCSIELHRQRRSSGHDIAIPEENLILIK